ncbi:MAG: hypothetical protein E7568_03210 [Ruminococcaceae bacterium]|nr:hypothetical protein [Oscillospiraceae bacterium]
MTEFQRQKEEATQRVIRMNERYRQKAGLVSSPPPLKKEVQKNPLDILKMFRFDSIKNDPDRLIIIFVFLLLGSEKCDEKLLYALLYIML